MIGSVIEVGNV